MAYNNLIFVEKTLYNYFDKITGKEAPFLPGKSFPKDLILEYKISGQETFMMHGHQSHWMNM